MPDAPTFNGPLRVTGGTGGVYADCADIETLAKLTEEVGATLAAIRSKCHDLMVHPDALASAVLNPTGVARFSAALLGAIDGREGLTWLALEFKAHGALLRAATRSYQALDQGYAKLIDSVRWAAGHAAGVGVTVGAGVAVAAAPLLAPALIGHGSMLALGGVGAYAAGEALGVDWAKAGTSILDSGQRLLSEHLGVIDTIIGASPGFITGLGGPWGPEAYDVPSGARILGSLYPDLIHRVEDLKPDGSAVMTKPPEGYGDLFDGLSHRNELAQNHPTTGDHQGQIDVRVVTHADGSKAYIVDIPGTKDPHPAPLGFDERLNDMSTNIHALGGEQTSYEKGIAEALRRAGYTPGAPVMMIGHSQGGMVAAQAASDPEFRNEFMVTHVVTAGSPIARYPIPDDVRVLSLENKYDPVPHLDGADNPDRRHRTTVKFDFQQLRVPPEESKTILNNHFMKDVYLPAGKSLDGSTDPSVVSFRDSAKDFFGRGGTTVEAKVYEITRQTLPAPPTVAPPPPPPPPPPPNAVR